MLSERRSCEVGFGEQETQEACGALTVQETEPHVMTLSGMTIPH